MIGILSYLIVCITDLSEEEVYDNIDIVNPYERSKNITLREMTHDLKVTIKNNTITLEMNQFNDRENIFRNSAHFHESIVKSLEASKHKDDIGRVQISFDAKVPYSDDLISRIMMMDIKNHLIDSSESNYIKYRVNLPKVKKIGYNEDELTRFEIILLIMMESKKERLENLAKGDKELEYMVKKIEEMSKDPNIVSYIKDENLRRVAYEMDMEESEKRGHESGYSEGASSKEKEIARNLLKKGMDINDISECTGLSIDEIKKFSSFS